MTPYATGRAAAAVKAALIPPGDYHASGPNVVRDEALEALP